MNAKALVLLGALALSACYPATELNDKNADVMLDATARVNQVSSIAVTGIQSHRALQSFKAFSPRTTETVTCHKGQGTYLVTVNDLNGTFDIVFNHCAGEDGGQLDGIVNGHIEQTQSGFTATLNGEVTATKNTQITYISPTSLTLAVSERSFLASTAYNGTFTIFSDNFEGTVNVQTHAPFGFDTRTYTHFGSMSFNDGLGNELEVELDNNGAHLTLNDRHIRFFSHTQWQAKTHQE